MAIRTVYKSARYVQNGTDNVFSQAHSAEQATVGIEALRCTGGAGETTPCLGTA
jgi:hypothetical protein